MLELLDSLVRKAYQFQQLAVFSKPTHEVSHLLSEFGVTNPDYKQKQTFSTLNC